MTMTATRQGAAQRSPAITPTAKVAGVTLDEFITDNVPTDRVIIDYRYARPLTPSRQAKLDKLSYDQRKAGTLLMSFRNDGTYAIIDGQGRLNLALRAGVKVVPSRVYIDLTVEQEAELYLAFNRDRTSTQPVDDFKTKLVARVPESLKIQSVLDDFGMRVMRGRGGPGTISSIVSIEYVYRTWGEATLRQALKLLTDSWHYDKKSLTGDMIQGATQFVLRYKLTPTQYTELISRLGSIDAGVIHSRAVRLREDEGNIHITTAIGRTFVNTYNTGRRSQANKLGPWADRVTSQAMLDAIPAKTAKMIATVKAKKATQQP